MTLFDKVWSAAALMAGALLCVFPAVAQTQPKQGDPQGVFTLVIENDLFSRDKQRARTARRRGLMER